MSERQADDLKRISLRAPAGIIDEVDELVEEGRYVNRSEAVRTALRELVRRGEVFPEALDCEDCGGTLVASHGSSDTIVYRCDDCNTPYIEET